MYFKLEKNNKSMIERLACLRDPRPQVSKNISDKNFFFSQGRQLRILLTNIQRQKKFTRDQESIMIFLYFLDPIKRGKFNFDNSINYDICLL